MGDTGRRKEEVQALWDSVERSTWVDWHGLRSSPDEHKQVFTELWMGSSPDRNDFSRWHGMGAGR